MDRPSGDFLVAKIDMTRVGPDKPRDAVHQGRLPGTVWTDDPVNLPLVNIEAHIRKGFETSEGLTDTFHRKNDCLAHIVTGARVAPSGSKATGASPSRRKNALETDVSYVSLPYDLIFLVLRPSS